MAGLLWLLPVWLVAPYVRRDPAPAEAPASGYGPLVIPLVFMALYLFCGATRDAGFFLLDWTHASVLDSAPGPNCLLDATLALAAVAWAALLVRPRLAGARTLFILLVLAQVLALAKLLQATGGAPLYRDDHPSFIYRLWQFGCVAPRNLTYDPHWNGGVTGAVLAETGVDGIGLLWWPLWRWLPTATVYTPLVGVTFVVVVPWLAAASLRVAGFSRTAAACAGILSLGFSSEFFLWALHFGTVGSALAGAFVIPFAAGLYRAFVLDRTDVRTAAWIVASGFMLVQWPPGILMALTIAAGVPGLPRAWSRRKLLFLTACALALALLHLRGLLDLLLACRDNVSYALTSTASAQPSPGCPAETPAAGRALTAGLHALFRQANRVHPLVLFGGVAGLAVLPDRRLARWLTPPLVLLALLAGWGAFAWPRLQMGRMAVPLFRMALMPAAVLAAAILDGAPGSAPRSRAWPALVLALLIAGGWTSARVFGNGGPATYVTPDKPLRALVDTIRSECPPGARVLFAGRTVHGYGGGHVAALPMLAGREMLACDYYAFPPDKVEYEYPPREFRRTPEGMRAFLELYNVGLVVTYHAKWAAYLADHPELAAPLVVIRGPDLPFHVFRVPSPPGLFARGSGRVRARFNRLDVDLDHPDAETVLRYNWDDRLRAGGGAELFPVTATNGVRLIGLLPNGQAHVPIRLAGWL